MKLRRFVSGRTGGWALSVGMMASALMLAVPAQAAVFKDASLQTLLDAGQADELERVASERLKAQPGDAQAAAALTLAQLDLADPAPLRQNIQRMEQCLQQQPSEGSCPYALALALVMQVRGGNKLKAIGALGRVSELMQKAMTLLPDATEPRSALQQYYLALPSFIGGGESKARALETGVTDADQLHLMRARVAAARKDWPSMEKELRAVRTQRPALLLEQRLLWNDLGREWMYQGQGAKARAWFEELIKRQPRQAMGHYGLARVLDSLGEHDAAIASFEKARHLNGAEQLGIDHRLGMALQSLGDKPGARAAYERCIGHRRAGAKDRDECQRRLTELGAPAAL